MPNDLSRNCLAALARGQQSHPKPEQHPKPKKRSRLTTRSSRLVGLLSVASRFGCELGLQVEEALPASAERLSSDPLGGTRS